MKRSLPTAWWVSMIASHSSLAWVIGARICSQRAASLDTSVERALKVVSHAEFSIEIRQFLPCGAKDLFGEVLVAADFFVVK